jgi:hypothetical protein
MPQVPQITLVASLQDPNGNIDVGGYLRVTLAGFGGLVPRVNGTAILSKARGVKLIQTAGGPNVISIYGNDVITPGPNITFYCIEVFDSKNNLIQSGNYQLSGSGAIDLSTLNQYFPPPPPVLGQTPVLTNPAGSSLQIINGSITIVGNLIVTGTINGGAVLFTVPSSAAPLFNGNQGGAFKTVLTVDAIAPNVVNMGNKLTVPIMIQQDGTGGHAFTWPANVHGAGFVNPAPNTRSVQIFFSDTDGSLFAAGPIQYA